MKKIYIAIISMLCLITPPNFTPMASERLNVNPVHRPREKNEIITKLHALELILQNAPFLEEPDLAYTLQKVNIITDSILLEATYHGLINGAEIKSFIAHTPITRAQFILYCDRIFNLEEKQCSQTTQIADIEKDKNPKMYNLIHKYLSYNVISLDGHGRYYPTEPLAINDAESIINKILELKR